MQHLKNVFYNRCNSMVKFLSSSHLLFSRGRFLLCALAICCLKLFLLYTVCAEGGGGVG